MIFKKTRLGGVFVIETEKIQDSRGFFARSWCTNEFSTHEIMPVIRQCNISFNHKRGTLRGMHYQITPFEEEKLVRCTRGEIFDVIIDIRTDSPTYMQHLSITLNEDNHTMLYIPKGFAHGFQTMKDNTEIFYQMSEFYTPDAARGIRWNDPSFEIEWPIVKEKIMSEKDQAYPDYAC